MTFKITNMTNLLNLPDGYTSRPPVKEDIPDAVELFNQCSLEMIGSREFSTSEIETDWSTPGLNPETNQRVVFSPEGDLVAYIEVWTLHETPVHPWVWGRVHPDHKGLGIGTNMLIWAENRAREVIDLVPEEARVAFRCGTVDGHQSSNDLLSDYGMNLIRHSYQMRIMLSEALPQPVWPEGITLRPFHPDDIEAVYRADDEAFADHFGYVPEDFESGLERFSHFFLNDEAYDPDLWFIAVDGDEIAGISLCRKHSWEDENIGWVSSLAVRRPWRKRGLGLALLQHSFNAFWQRGKAGVGLGVDAENLSGALRLYKKAGMHVHRKHNLYQKELRPGKDLSTH